MREGMGPAPSSPGAPRLMLTCSKRRTWWYVQKPAMFECACDNCGGRNLDWSEFKGMIWCYDCQLDTAGTGGIFSGPIPINLVHILGMRFDIWHDRLKRVLYYHPDTNQYWSRPPKAARRDAPERASREGSHP